jgi:membrane protein implicated in regulation of membrane protease activity
MPYTLRLYLCLFIVGFVAFVLVDWLSPLGPVVNALLAAVVAYLTILVGQRVLGRRICSDARLRRTGGRNGTALVTSS